MKKATLKLALFFVSITLAACSNMSSHQQSSAGGHAMQANTTGVNGTEVASGAAVGGGIGRSMDENDKSKLSRALDKPLGKSTQWVNANSNTTYIVVPTQKVEINGNPYCRKYTVTATNGGNSHEMNGTACVAANSNWEAVGG